jgi:hypothetical protein
MTNRDYSTEERSRELKHSIDPGFVNRRLAETILKPDAMKLIDQQIKDLPDLPGGLRETRINHIYSTVLLMLCEVVKAKTLSELLAAGNGTLFCSTEVFQPCPTIHDSSRVESFITPHGNTDFKVILEYGTEHILSDTLRAELEAGDLISVIAIFRKKEGNTLYFRPIVMGAPWMSGDDEGMDVWAMWENSTHFEHFIEDFKEFERIRETPVPQDFAVMELISEKAFKQCLAKLLGDQSGIDWGGEMSDHFTSQLHLNNKRVTAAFLLKGPAKFSPMKLNHLGKNNDQIYRLAQEPAQVLFVQHCHDIESAVRATLRAFAVQPGRPRRYCLIDGRDSLRLLQAYNLVDEALALSK